MDVGTTSQRNNVNKEFHYTDKDIEQLVYVVSHDLREPLRTIASYVQLLQKRYKGKLDHDAEEFIAFAVDGVHRMKNMLDDLLLYSRLNRGAVNKEPTDLKIVVKQAADKIRRELGYQNHIIVNSELPKIPVNPEQINLLFYNLLNNSFKFNENQEPRVELSNFRKDGYWQFSVKDNGIGIESKYSEKIFNIFQKLHNRKDLTGTGTGLAICKKIVESHGGKIWFESKPGEGTTFFFTIKET
jgi:light-regulated signal transduction histidine kinase (bacteriophytochrome)